MTPHTNIRHDAAHRVAALARSSSTRDGLHLCADDDPVDSRQSEAAAASAAPGLPAGGRAASPGQPRPDVACGGLRATSTAAACTSPHACLMVREARGWTSAPSSAQVVAVGVVDGSAAILDARCAHHRRFHSMSSESGRSEF